MREPTQSVPWIPRRRSSDGEDGALAIRSVRPEGRRGFESWLMRYGAPYKWRDATKVLVILTALSFIAGLFTLCCLFLRGWPVLWGASPTILRYATWFALGYTGVALLLTARAWLHRRDEAPAPVAVIVAVFFQAIVNGSFAEGTHRWRAYSEESSFPYVPQWIVIFILLLMFSVDLYQNWWERKQVQHPVHLDHRRH